MIGASAGTFQTAVWTEEGELFTFGDGMYGKLGHEGQQEELVPRLVEALSGKNVVGAAAGTNHTVVWTDAGSFSLHLWARKPWGAGPRRGTE